MKIDCSNILNYKKELYRMCQSFENCKGCPFDCKSDDDCEGKSFEIITQDHIDLLQKWSDEHPRKTLLEDLLEKYPTVPLDKDNVPDICPNNLGYENYEDRPCDTLYCTECWNRTLEEVEEE